jgi:hypothetical protein
LPFTHFAHDEPPQSMSVSFPFLTRSVQLGDWQMLPMQTPLAHSPGPAHTMPVLHLAHPAPPQSISVSVPFLTLSAHVAAWQTRGVPEHTLLTQSPAPVHVLPAVHFGHDEPQSVSVSVPFLTLSEQVGA